MEKKTTDPFCGKRNVCEGGRKGDQDMTTHTRTIGAILALTLSASHAAHASQPFRDEVCGDLRAEQPALTNPIRVTCHFPVGVVDHPRFFACPALPGGDASRPVDAETFDMRCDEANQ